MKKILLLTLILFMASISSAQNVINFWDQQRKGANCPNKKVEKEYWLAAAELGLDFVRLIPDNWKANQRDFLIGNADDFSEINEADVETLIQVLDEANEAGIKVILTMFSLPGARWIQLNNNKTDDRLWREMKYHKQAAVFWQQLAKRLNNHPAIVAFNPLNEPHPEKSFGFEGNNYGEQFAQWVRKIKDSPADLNAFNHRIVAAIREVDKETPIILDGWFYASPEGFPFIEPVEDNAILYAFHYYEPWIYTTFRVNKERFSYPGKMPGKVRAVTEEWSIENHRNTISPVIKWARANKIPMNRIIASEFGVDRRVGGATEYLSDLIKVFNENDWHWAFYSFRPDGAWTGLDYELGTQKVNWRIYEAEERGEDLEKFKKRGNNPMWELFVQELRNKKQ